MDVQRRIQAFNAGRDPERLRLKYARMRRSPFAFLRGTCHLFYEDLSRSGIFKSAPPAWSCGDLHLENFGSYKADNGLVYFDINDFDEAALAPVTWDLVRLLTSLRLGADYLKVDAAVAASLCRRFIEAYAAALDRAKAYGVERDTAQGLGPRSFARRRARSPPCHLSSTAAPSASARSGCCGSTARRPCRRRRPSVRR